jgi:hypothetical protein
MFRIELEHLAGVALLLVATGIHAQEAETSVTLEDLHAMLQKQQQLIEQQQATIDQQSKALSTLSQRLDAVAQQQTAGAETAPPSDELVSLREQVAAVEKLAQQNRTEMPANVLTAGEFKGSIRLPGTNMAGRLGGNVRLGLVNNFSPLGSEDRFIVGSIPVPGDESSAEGDLFKGVSISTKRSRLNLDMRMDSSVGQFRAFVEGDFVTEVDSSDVFRLRHAYGQYKRILVGQTWSTFMDLKADPEELDFEGLNGEVTLRRPPLRWTHKLGDKRMVSVGVEDPAADIANGASTGSVPDLVGTINFQRASGHFQLGGLFRHVEAAQDAEPDGGTSLSGSAVGWGLSFSGSQALHHPDRGSKLMWQLNFGEAIGHYINDTATIGGQDAVFGPDGSLEALPAFGGYVAFHHRWHRDPLSRFTGKSLLKSLRSTLVYGYTRVDTFDFQPDDAYAETQRVSVNLIWSPIAPIDLGIEYLWGARKNKDGNKGTASQLQFVATFNF